MTKERQFILTLNYKSDASEWETISHDVIEAKSLTELLTRFNIAIAGLHRKLIEEVQQAGVDYDDIPF